MRFILLAILAIAAIAAVIWLVRMGIQAMLKRERQKQLAKHAPELLQYHDIPAPVTNLIVELRQQNAEAARIMEGVLYRDNYYGADDMEKWLHANDKKELTQ